MTLDLSQIDQLIIFIMMCISLIALGILVGILIERHINYKLIKSGRIEIDGVIYLVSHQIKTSDVIDKEIDKILKAKK